jgi:hypothetical protein
MQSDSSPSSAKHLNYPDFELEIDLGSGQEYPKVKCQLRLNTVEVEEVQLMKPAAPAQDAPPPIPPAPISEQPSPPPPAQVSKQPPSPLPAPELPPSSSLPEVEPGWVEVCAALAGIAAAIATFLSGMSSMTENLRGFVALLALFAGILAVFSAYSALWLLARRCLQIESPTGLQEIWALLKSPARGPYWFMALSLFVLLVLSFLTFALSIARIIL